MPVCQNDTPPAELLLPDEFDDLAGLLQADVKAIATALTHRAQERLLLSKRESRRLYRSLLSNLSASINETMAPLSADLR